MFLKLLTTLAFATLVAVALLGLRQQRLEAMHDMAQLQAEMDQARQHTWDLQVRIAGRMEPGTLLEAMDRAELALEPVIRHPHHPIVQSDRSARLVEAPHGRR